MRRSRLVMRATMNELHRFADWLDAVMADCPLPERVAYATRLCLEEVVVNVVSHAYEPGAEGDVEIDLACSDSAVDAIVSDTGRPFNPLESEPRRPATSLEEAAVGGWGITLSRHFAKSMEYARMDNHNRLSMVLA